jgi:hypothetical protein
VINPFIYAIGNRKYRLAYLNLFSKVKFWDTPFNSASNKRGATATDVNRHHIDNSNSKGPANSSDPQHKTPATDETEDVSSSKEVC